MFGRFFRLFRKSAPALHPLAVQARSNDAAERVKAAVQLGELRESWVPDELLRLLMAYTETVRDAGKEALRRQQAAALPALLEALRNPRLEVSVPAAELLGELRAPEAIEPLLIALKFSDRPLRNAAWRALEQYGSAATKALSAKQDEADPWVRARVEELLAKGRAEAVSSPAPAILEKTVADDRIERQRAIVAEHFALENAHRWDAVVDSFTAAEPAFELMSAGVKFAGKSGVATAYGILSAALPDVEVQEVRGWDVPGCSVREIAIAGTHNGDYFGIPASGRRVRIEIACFFEFDAEGRLATERVYFDNARLFAQMRGEQLVESGTPSLAALGESR